MPADIIYMAMKISTKKILIAALSMAALLSFTACGKQKQNDSETAGPASGLKSKDLPHKWYHIGRNGIQEIALPKNAPVMLEKPWTEALRISYIGQSKNENELLQDSTENNIPKVYALTNRLGMIVFSGNETTVYDDTMFFEDNTTGDMIFMNNMPVFSIYRNSIFNGIKSKYTKTRPFLIHFDMNSGVFYPALTYENLSVNPKSEITDYIWNGKNFFCTIKNDKENRTEFTYLKWTPSNSMISVPSESARIPVTEISADEYRRQTYPQKFTAAPERIKSFLAFMPENLPFYLECKKAGGFSSKTYVHGKETSGEIPSAKVQIAETWTGAVFTDGTMYLSGALFGKHILNGGKAIALRLPKLPEGFIYTDFGISGTTLIVSWEDNNFYKTGTAGILTADLGKILYGGDNR